MKIKALREASLTELQEELDSLCRELFSLRMQKVEGVKPHLFSRARRNVARIKTLINERKADSK